MGKKNRPGFPQSIPGMTPNDVEYYRYALLPGRPQQPKASDSDETKYEPSKTLRELITDRLVEQSMCLLKIVNEYIEPLVADAITAEQQVGGKKGPGDRYIGAQKVAAITKMGGIGAPGFGLGLGGSRVGPRMAEPRSFIGLQGGIGGMIDPYSARVAYREAMGRRGGRQRLIPRSFSGWPIIPGGGPPGSGGDGKAKDPMERYLQLAAEIDALMGMSGVEGLGSSGSYQAMADGYGATANPTKRRFKQIAKIVGSGGEDD
ncbi:hypothetical protein LTR36_005837 [Oleoguttula mirabilis]|uniref:Uncharacterized protein n=1 Tax=Oleoguttula mirabilis TaxID=1507867 RepID=A0AAV9JD57_9PEZI|nr:hypothetical protein LTR36_005837 [Oleoguttula mirabilis]